MKKTIAAFIPVMLLAILLISFTSVNTKNDLSHTSARWEKLGERKVNFKVDRDEIGVGRFEGFFDALQIKVRKGPINMHKMEVHFGNGDMKEIELRNNFTAGSVSRIIDLPGNNRIISKVVFWYDTKNFSSSRAIVELWGRH